MSLLSRVSVLGATVLVLGPGLLIWSLRPSPGFVPTIRLPPGVSLVQVLQDGEGTSPKGWHNNIYCQDALPTRARGFRERLELIRQTILCRACEFLGRSLYAAPNAPTVDYLTPRLGECFDISGEKYLLAKEFVWKIDARPTDPLCDPFLAFVWKGTNRLQGARDRISRIEGGILNNGIIGLRITWPSPEHRGTPTFNYLSTNRCAIVRDVQGLVKIIPLGSLKAYAAAGLVKLD